MTQECKAASVNECTCCLKDVWEKRSIQLTIYPISKVFACRGMLMRYLVKTSSLFGIHRMHSCTEAKLIHWSDSSNLEIWTKGYSPQPPHLRWGLTCPVVGVGMEIVRRLQRWWRRVSPMRRQAIALAVAMSLHHRLGNQCSMACLNTDMIRKCVALAM